MGRALATALWSAIRRGLWSAGDPSWPSQWSIWSGPRNPIWRSAPARAVAAKFATLLNHARLAAVEWKIAGLFAVAGVFGAFLGLTLGKAVDGQKLLALFAVLMLVVGVLMLRGRSAAATPTWS